MTERIKLRTVSWFVKRVDYNRAGPYAAYTWVRTGPLEKARGVRLRIGSKLIGVFWL